MRHPDTCSRLHLSRLILLICAALILSACSHQPDSATLYTEAAATIIAEQTETAAAASPTPLPTETPAPTDTVEPTVDAIVLPTMPAIAEIPLTEAVPTEDPGRENPYKAEVVEIGPSPNQFLPGQQFTWTISLKNTGTVTWSSKYTFSYSKGIQLANQGSFPIDTVTPPGGILTINMKATAPTQEGTHQTEWKFTNPEGIAFYYIYYNVIVGDTTFITPEAATTAPTATPNSLDWMCSDAARSNIQQQGCDEYCRNNAATMLQNGKNCYSYGVHIYP